MEKVTSLSTQFYGNMLAPRYSDLVNDYKSVYQKVDLNNKNVQEVKNDIQGLAGFLKKAEK
jgi:hypothetical protein